MEIKVRVAPSPTGNLHVGTAQSALYNYLFARKNGGEFHVRVEDTDQERSTKKFEDNILEGLGWLGLEWDGPVTRSSDNKDEYKKYLQQLLDSGKAFWCNHSKEELEAEQKRQMADKEAPRHVCSHKIENLTTGQVVRLAVDEISDREVEFDDLVRGPIKFKTSLLGDFSIARNLDSALYHFAVVIDDVELGATHIIRGEDHISNTPKHILIYEALGHQVPRYAHLPLLLGVDRSKLSKRNGQTSVAEYKNDYLPEAIINFLGIIGHTFSKEIINLKEMSQEFEMTKVHKSGAVFDLVKLNWINSQYIKRLSSSEFKAAVQIPEIPEIAVALITERLEKLNDVQNFDYFWKNPEYGHGLLIWKNSSVEDVKKSLKASRIIMEKNNDEGAIRLALDDLGKQLENRGLAYWPLRVALTGKDKSPDPVDVALALPKDEVLRRIDVAIKKLEQ